MANGKDTLQIMDVNEWHNPVWEQGGLLHKILELDFRPSVLLVLSGFCVLLAIWASMKLLEARFFSLLQANTESTPRKRVIESGPRGQQRTRRQRFVSSLACLKLIG